MTLTTDPDVQSWLAKEPAWLGPCVARLNGERSTFSAVDEGHWIVAAEADGTLTRAGRILRIRGDLDTTTIYFDHVHTFRTSGTLSGLGLTLPTGPIARLRPEDLTGIFALDGISIADVPLVQDVAYVRDLLEIAVRDDLLGPAGGPHELIKDMSVRDRYLVGKLAPRRPGDADTVAIEPAAGADEIRDIEDERAAPVHEPGAEFASAYQALGSQVSLISSRDRVLPGEDPDAATVIEDVFRKRGMEVLSRSRMAGVEATDDGVVVTLEDGREVTGTHALLAVGSIPQTAGLGLETVGVDVGPGGHILVDKVSRTSARGIYAAGDCTGLLPLASVAAMQGRVAMAHALGDAVAPLRLDVVSANIFTNPEIATVGVGAKEVEADQDVEAVMLPLATNPRAKMLGITDGFVKLFAQKGSGAVIGGVVVAPRASELIFPVTLAVQNRLNVDQVASTFTVYPSLTGSIAEAARRLHATD